MTGKEFAALRKQNRLTLDDVARVLDMSATAVHKYEKFGDNEASIPEKHHIKLATLLGCNLDELQMRRPRPNIKIVAKGGSIAQNAGGDANITCTNPKLNSKVQHLVELVEKLGVDWIIDDALNKAIEIQHIRNK